MELTEALESAFDTAQPEAATTVETPAVVETQTAAERARDEAGRFAKVENASIPAPKADPAQTAPVPQVAQEAAQPVQAKTPPSSWRKEVAEKYWSQFAPEVQDEVLRREADFHKGIESWRSNADKGKAFEQAIAPFQDNLKAANVDAVTAVKELLGADHILRNAPESVKVQKLLELAGIYGIDLRKEFSPDVAKYEQELFQTREQLKQFQTQQQLASQQSLNSDIEAFKAAPGHEHFEAVRAHMAALLQGGQAKDLSDAYDMAVYANPETRAALLQQQAAQASAGAQAQRAKAAAVSVRGSSPASGATSAAMPHASLKDAVAAAFDQHTS